jgi:hypothetical protein
MLRTFAALEKRDRAVRWGKPVARAIASLQKNASVRQVAVGGKED